MPVIID